MDIFLFLLVSVFIYQMMWWFFSVLKRDNSWVDVAWGIGFLVISLLAFFQSYTFLSTLKIIVLVLILVWGVRLSLHLLLRKLAYPGEDKRYKEIRKTWGDNTALFSLFSIFWLQGLFMFIILLPVLWVMGSDVQTVSSLSFAGVFIWLFGFLFEVVADFQLAEFKKHHKKDHIMNKGLWRYSRHPNYFGEATLWWGMWLIVIGSGAPLWTVIGPITITFLLLWVSGVTLLEKHYHGHAGYHAYQKKTSSFVPWIPNE